MTAQHGRWYSPDEEWPDHQKSWFQESLIFVRSSGWHLKKFTGHTWGKVYCQRPTENLTPCAFIVFSTGRSGENAAMEMRKQVTKCPHSASPFATASKRLSLVERMVDAATRLIERLRLRANYVGNYERAEELLSYAEAEAKDIEQLIEEGDANLRMYDAVGEEVEASLSEAGIEERSVEGLVEAAEDIAAEVKSNLRQLPQSSQVKALKERLKAVEAKLRDLRARLNLAREDDV